MIIAWNTDADGWAMGLSANLQKSRTNSSFSFFTADMLEM